MVLPGPGGHMIGVLGPRRKLKLSLSFSRKFIWIKRYSPSMGIRPWQVETEANLRATVSTNSVLPRWGTGRLLLTYLFSGLISASWALLGVTAVGRDPCSLQLPTITIGAWKVSSRRIKLIPWSGPGVLLPHPALSVCVLEGSLSSRISNRAQDVPSGHCEWKNKGHLINALGPGSHPQWFMVI